MKILLKNSIQFYLSADTGYKANIPFVQDFVRQVMDTSKNFYDFYSIETLRSQYLKSSDSIDFIDFGTGNSDGRRQIRDIAKSSLSSKTQCRMLFNLVNRYQPETIVELGTSLGIATMYMASARRKGRLYTFEGNPATVQLVQNSLRKLQYTNVDVIEGDFTDTLQPALDQINRVDLAFIDGNHAYTPTMDYFKLLKSYCNEDSILIFDDIYWSEEMNRAWHDIKSDPSVTIALDLYFMGIVFFKNVGASKIDKKLIQSKYKPFRIG